jgi:carbonic anhydrase
MLRSITQRIFVAVREAANGLKEVWDPDARDMPGYREALIEAAICINAAQAAFDLHQEVERTGKWEIEVLYGVHNIRNHQVCMPVDPTAPRSDENVRLAHAPTNPKEFHALAIQMAQILKPGCDSRPDPTCPEGDGQVDGPRASSGSDHARM